MLPGEESARMTGGVARAVIDESATGDVRTAGLRAEFINFYDSEYFCVVRFLMRVGASLQDAEDAAQEAFICAWVLTAPPGRWADIAAPRAWIRTVALRKFRLPPSLRRPVTTVPVSDFPDTPHPGASDADLTPGTLLVLDALRSLAPAPQAVMAFHLDGFSAPEIAAQLGMTDQRARDLLKKARKILASTLTTARDQERSPAP